MKHLEGVSLERMFRNIQTWDERFVPEKLPLAAINVLPQPRRTFDGIEDLAEGIAVDGLLYGPTVAEFTEEQCDGYLETLNTLWGVSLRRQDITSTDTPAGKRYYILLAGERRFRACSILWFIGCSQCQPRGVSEGECFSRHFGEDLLPVQVGKGIPPLRALYVQFKENTHVQVPPQEEAPAIAQLYELVLQIEPDMSVTAFASRISMGLGKVRAALLYNRLPNSIKDAVERGQFSYGHALELARLQDDGEDEESLHRWATRALAKGLHVKGFRELVNRHLAEKHSGQTGLFDQSAEAELARASHRQTLVPSYLAAARVFRDYLSRVENAFAEGRLGQEDSPFSELAPVRAFQRLVELQQRMLENHFRQRLPAAQREPIAMTLANLSKALEERADMLERQAV